MKSRIYIAKSNNQFFLNFIYLIQPIISSIKPQTVIVIENISNKSINEKVINDEIINLLKEGLKTKFIANLLSKKYQINPNLIYKIILKLKNNTNKI